jgi:hypothetical protein
VSASPDLHPVLPADRAELVRAVAQLDELYAHGDLDEAAYRAERTRHTSRLLDLTRSAAGAP